MWGSGWGPKVHVDTGYVLFYVPYIGSRNDVQDAIEKLQRFEIAAQSHDFKSQGASEIATRLTLNSVENEWRKESQLKSQ